MSFFIAILALFASIYFFGGFITAVIAGIITAIILGLAWWENREEGRPYNPYRISDEATKRSNELHDYHIHFKK